MKADTLDLTQLFANPVRYLVPIFQRPYVWTQEDHWEPLWQDVQGVADSALKRQELGEDVTAVPPHFLGAIVLDQVLNPTGSLQARYVIDGQQRLTTMQLFLSAAGEVAGKHGFKQATTLDRLTRNPDDLVEDDEDHRFKVWPTMRDRPAFVAVMHHDGPLATSADHGGHRMAYAEDYFRGQIEEWVVDTENGTSADDRMKVLMAVIGRMLKVVVIDLEPNDNAQVIFETLNARGTRLLASDLVKNLIFQRAADSDADAQVLYDTYWQPFDTDHWRRQIRQGRLNRPRVEVFLFHWLTMLTGTEVGASRLFQTFKSVLDGGEATVTEILADFASDGAIFESFNNQPNGSVGQRFFYRLEALDTTTLLPAILWLYRQPADVLDSSARNRALLVMESWLVRRMVCRVTTKNYNRFFLELLGLLKENPAEADKILFETLAGEEAESQLWPSDEQFLQWLTTQPLYDSLAQKRVRMLLLAFEDRLRRDAQLNEDIPASTSFHIEHVLPQSWQENWPLPGDAPMDAEQQRHIAKHMLGNLTLVTDKLNPSMSNGPWETKKSGIDEHSLLMLNRRLLKGDPPNWDEQTIDARGAELARLALQIWPGPGADFPMSFDHAG